MSTKSSSIRIPQDTDTKTKGRANGFGAEFGDCAPKVYSILREGAIGESKQNKKKKEEKPLGFSTLNKTDYEDVKKDTLSNSVSILFAVMPKGGSLFSL